MLSPPSLCLPPSPLKFQNVLKPHLVLTLCAPEATTMPRSLSGLILALSLQALLKLRHQTEEKSYPNSHAGYNIHVNPNTHIHIKNIMKYSRS